jgi:esterase/lipase superfamily enzyme
MKREYVSWYSPALQKDMEMLVFGDTGAPIIFFPPRMGRFYDYENWKVIDVLKDKIEKGYIQVFCVDSYDTQSFYNAQLNPSQKILAHIQYEHYIIGEAMPFIRNKNPGAFIIAAGCSLGGYHALNFALKYPGLFNKVVSMSGRYDLTVRISHYDDLFNGYWDENVYFNMPLQYLKNLNDEHTLKQLRELDIVLVIGRDDVLYENNLLMHQYLFEKQAKSTLHAWDREMHRAKSWRQMVNVYL